MVRSRNSRAGRRTSRAPSVVPRLNWGGRSISSANGAKNILRSGGSGEFRRIAATFWWARGKSFSSGGNFSTCSITRVLERRDRIWEDLAPACFPRRPRAGRFSSARVFHSDALVGPALLPASPLSSGLLRQDKPARNGGPTCCHHVAGLPGSRASTFVGRS